MRKIIIALAALAAVCSTPAWAQLVISRSQSGAVGNIVSTVDPSGTTGKAVISAAVVYDSAGVEKGTVGNPLITQAQGNTTIAGSTGAFRQITDNADGVATNSTSNEMNAVTRNTIYNGTSWDRGRSITGSIGSAGVGVTAIEYAGASFSNIATLTTTTVKSGAGILHKVCVNTKGATANTATIYDNTTATGSKIGTLDTTSGVGCLVYDAAFATGLTIVTAAGTAADLTIIYR